MPCEECEQRRRHVEESTALLRDKEHKYRWAEPHELPRLLGSYRHQLKQALLNLAHHEGTCTERQP